jgi:hypothetical protein
MARGYRAVDSQYLRITTFEWIENRSWRVVSNGNIGSMSIYWVRKEAKLKLD